jgi:hypothetical protein
MVIEACKGIYAYKSRSERSHRDVRVYLEIERMEGGRSVVLFCLGILSP